MPTTRDPIMTDLQLLNDFVATRSDHAFAQIRARHAGWIHSAALRKVRDPHLAEDVTQAVFIILAAKAASLRKQTILSAWLFRVLHFTTRTALRAQRRRRSYEQKAAEMRTENSLNNASADKQFLVLSATLEEQVAQLRKQDRQAVLLRFYERKSFPEMAALLGVSEDAARKRVGRAVEVLRHRFATEQLLSAAELSTLLAANTVAKTAPALTAAASPSAQAIARSTLTTMTAVKLKIGAAVAATAAVLTLLLVFAFRPPAALTQQNASPGSLRMRPAPALGREFRPVLARTPALDAFPIPPNWPLALPGSITGTPVVADLLGNGKPVILIPCQPHAEATLIHPSPRPAAMLFAINLDGTIVPGFPIDLVNPTRHRQMEADGRYTDWWTSSPSVCTDRQGKRRIVITTPYFQGFRIISPDGKMREHRGGSQWANVPLVDIDRDGQTDIITGAGILTIDGATVKPFPASSHPIARLSGYAPCIGDANDDGELEVYHLFADTVTKLKKGSPGFFNDAADIAGYDHLGQPLPGWPQQREKGDLAAYPPVMGDITGDTKKEIISADRHAIRAWTWDGHPVLPGEGAFKEELDLPLCSATLADLDGDGKAEIIVFDKSTHAIRAWHGDGTGVGNSDGIIAKLDTDPCGISVANLGNDGQVDLFAGAYWVRFNPKTAQSTINRLLPGDEETNQTQPTIFIDDGKADVVVGLKDGRVFIYQTGLSCTEASLQWPTANGNPQHTGCWTRPTN